MSRKKGRNVSGENFESWSNGPQTRSSGLHTCVPNGLRRSDVPQRLEQDKSQGVAGKRETGDHFCQDIGCNLHVGDSGNNAKRDDEDRCNRDSEEDCPNRLRKKVSLVHERWRSEGRGGEAGDWRGLTYHLGVVDLARHDASNEGPDKDDEVPPVGHLLVLAHEPVVHVVVPSALVLAKDGPEPVEDLGAVVETDVHD